MSVMEYLVQVVDGKQRLTSIWSFVQGSFPDGGEFRLSGLEVYSEINGMDFFDLNENQQETIKDYALNVHTITQQNQPDYVFEVFERLNMGSTQLNEQELRNCIYQVPLLPIRQRPAALACAAPARLGVLQLELCSPSWLFPARTHGALRLWQGPYTDMLLDLAYDPYLLKVLKTDTPHVRMKDRELILRFFAMSRTTPYGFFSPVKTWLNSEIRENRNLSPGEVEDLSASFQHSIQLAWDVFGEAAFRPVRKVKGKEGMERFESGEVNVALWDTVMHSFSTLTASEVLPHR
ncbi:hypothetical protein CYMTET_28677, partial [Cymbomonas tetramitiformis]